MSLEHRSCRCTVLLRSSGSQRSGHNIPRNRLWRSIESYANRSRLCCPELQVASLMRGRFPPLTPQAAPTPGTPRIHPGGGRRRDRVRVSTGREIYRRCQVLFLVPAWNVGGRNGGRELPGRGRGIWIVAAASPQTPDGGEGPQRAPSGGSAAAVPGGQLGGWLGGRALCQL